MKKWQIVLGSAIASIAMVGCGKSKSKGGSGGGSFPAVNTIASSVVPYVSSSALLTALDTLNAPQFSTLTETYDADTSHFAADRAYIADVLGNNLSGVNTQIAVQLNQLSTQVQTINSTYSDSDGNPTSCTQVIDKEFGGHGTDALTIPFFSSAASGPFWAVTANLSAVPRATCYVKVGGSDSAFVFGRTAIASPSVGCTDAYVYVVVNGYSAINATNSSEVAQRGTKTSGHQSQVFYYNGCTKDVGIGMTLSTKYSEAVTSANDEFNARFELWGNVTTNVFQVRVNKFDGFKGGNGGFNSIKGAGKASAGGNFLLAMTKYNCTNTGCSTVSISQANRIYCLANGSTAGSVSVDATTGNCATHEASFEDSALAAFGTGDSTVIPRSVVDFSSAAVFGL